MNTSGLLRGCPEKVTLIQIDAHADLRDELDGERILTHAQLLVL